MVSPTASCSVRTSYLDGVDERFDLIAANPPYVRDGDAPGLSPSVRREPAVALFGGADGLRGIECVLDAVMSHLRPQGWLLMEFGFGQEDGVREAVARAPVPALRPCDRRSAGVAANGGGTAGLSGYFEAKGKCVRRGSPAD